MPDATRSGNSATSSLTIRLPRSASRSRMRRRVGSPSARKRASLLSAIPCVHHFGELLENPVDVGTALITVYRLRPIGPADACESLVNEGDPGPGGGCV